MIHEVVLSTQEALLDKTLHRRQLYHPNPLVIYPDTIGNNGEALLDYMVNELETALRKP